MSLTVNQLMARLRTEQKRGNGKLPCALFAHDHEPSDSEQGDGPVRAVYEVTDETGKTFIALCA